MRPVVVFSQELFEQKGEFSVASPGFVFEPFFEGPDKALGNAIGLRSVAGNEDMNEFFGPS